MTTKKWSLATIEVVSGTNAINHSPNQDFARNTNAICRVQAEVGFGVS
jgi:hypothetical protein